MMKPLVSIIMPTFNQINYIKEAIASVLDQSYKNWELLIIDNASTDGTDDFLESLQDVRIRVFNLTNEGIIARSRNFGVDNSRGELIAFLDSDDRWEETKLEVSIREINEGADFVFHDMSEIDSLGKIIGLRISRDLKSPAWRDLILRGNVIPNSSVLTRRALLMEVGGMSEKSDLIGIEDFNTWLKLAFLGIRFKHLPLMLGCYRVHSGSVSTNSNGVGPAYPAFSEFLELLSRSDRRKISSNFFYHSGRMALKAGNFKNALKFFFKALNLSGSLAEAKSLVFIPFTLFLKIFRS